MLSEATLGPWRGTTADLRISTAAGSGHCIANDRPAAVARAVGELTGPVD